MFSLSDTGIYVASGMFTILVFVLAIAAVVGLTAIGLTARTVVTLTVGFLIFMGVYFVSMAVYRGIERGTESER